MDFSLSEETMILKTSAQRFLKKNCPPAHVRECMQNEKGFSAGLWKEIADLGWLGLIHGEEFGGAGGTCLDLCVLLQEMGGVLLPGPFLYSTLCGILIDRAGGEEFKKTCLPRLIKGEYVPTLAIMDLNAWEKGAGLDLKAARAGDGSLVLNGTQLLVPYAGAADEIFLFADLNGSRPEGSTLFRVPVRAPGLKLTSLQTISTERLYAIRCDNVKLAPEALMGAPGQGRELCQLLLQRAALGKCSEMVGGMERLVDMTVGYIKQRNQFGRPLGSLQAVQHFCSDMETSLRASQLLVFQAATLLDEKKSCHKEVSMAKAFCSEGYKRCSWIAQQLHGAIGFTEEYDLHLYYRHAKATELCFGDSRAHRLLVAAAMGYRQ